jgi:hypothetical protein
MSMGLNLKNDLLIDLYSRGIGRERGKLMQDASTDPRHGDKVIEYKYSIHPSQNSALGLNTINLTVRFASGVESTLVLYTTAVKKSNGFAPLLTRRCADLSPQEYDVKPGNTVTIGDISRDFTMFVSAFISSKIDHST